MTDENHDSPTVMFVNDSSHGGALKQSLELSGYCVLEADNALDAVDAVEDYTGRERPDLVLIDLDQPQDGSYAVRLIRNGADMGRVPVVLLSNLDEPNYFDEVLAAGCSECVAKPVEFEELKHILDTLLLDAFDRGKVIARSASV